MTYESIEYVIRAGLGRHEWTMLISFPDKAEPSVSQANGSRGDAIATAHKRIDGWMTRQRRKARLTTHQPNPPNSCE
jgi:hypothetical protein